MTTEQQTSPPATKSLTLNPWMVAGAALLLYGISLNHWVTLRSMPWIASVTGWDWHLISTPWRPSYFAPLWLVVTFPVRVLPVGWQPVALNLLAAVCAALTLALLAQSVRLFPHDRTRDERIREQGEFSLLSGRWAFVPQLFAILMLGLQGAFWDNAVSASNEMLDLLVFAFLIYSLMRFRIVQDERWLHAMAFVYGLGVTNNFAMIGFFPLFLIALIWIKGLSFFNTRFIGRMAAYGSGGLLLYLLVPLLGSIGSQGQSFGGLLYQELRQSYLLLRMIPGWIALVASLSTIAPLLCAGFRWPEIEGELSAAGNFLTRFTFTAMNVLFLPVALLIFFNWRFSTNPEVHDAPTPFLTFYYLGALAVGYYAGYILIVFGKRSLQRAKFKTSPIVNRSVLGLLWILLFAAPIWLFYTNFGHLRFANNGLLSRFTAQTIAALPTQPSVILSDDPVRLQLLEAGYRKAGKTNPHILLESGSLPYKEYINHLVRRYPQLQKNMISLDKIPPVLPQPNVGDFIFQLGRQYPIYYLHPSFGFFFEQFYLRPHHLVYEMKSYSGNSFLPPPPTPAEISDNQEFWKSAKQTTLTSLPQLAEVDWDAARVAVDYSVALDFWGVELQRINRLPEAHATFAEAYRIDTNNFMAKYNLAYNDHLQRGDRSPVDDGDTLNMAMSFYRSVPAIIKYNGPPDEPDVDLAYGQTLAQGGNLRQAAGLFERRLQLLPNDIPAKMAVAKTLVDTGRPDQGLELIRQIRAQTNVWPDELFWVEAVAYLAKTNFPEAERSLLQGQQQRPDNPYRLANVLEFYRRTGLGVLREGHHDLGVARLQKALAYANSFIQLLTVNKAVASRFTLTDVLMIKADVEVGLESWEPANQTLSRIIDIDGENPDALLNRAVVLTHLKQYSAAKDDAEALRKAMPKEPAVSYSLLAEIAAAEKDVDSEKKNLRLFLKYASADTPRYAAARKQLDALEAH